MYLNSIYKFYLIGKIHTYIKSSKGSDKMEYVFYKIVYMLIYRLIVYFALLLKHKIIKCLNTKVMKNRHNRLITVLIEIVILFIQIIL